MDGVSLVRDGTLGVGGGGGWERCGSYESNRDTVEFSRKNGFRVNKTISKVKMFE